MHDLHIRTINFTIIIPIKIKKIMNLYNCGPQKKNLGMQFLKTKNQIFYLVFENFVSFYLQTRTIFKPFLHGRFFHYDFIFLLFYFHFHLIVPFSTKHCYTMESGKTQTSPCFAKCFNILFLSFFNQFFNKNLTKIKTFTKWR
jgi:hypothetical protein